MLRVAGHLVHLFLLSSPILSKAVVKSPVPDVLITVKTTSKFHNSRVQDIVDSWWQDSPKQAFFFTDADDATLNATLEGHLINTRCGSGHERRDLCCKMSSELQFYLSMDARFYCHFDDDNYVNVPNLRQFLGFADSNTPLYLGKPSMAVPFRVGRHKFLFGTGGAGICLSRGLVDQLRPHLYRNSFVDACERLGLPDDVTLGYISSVVLGTKLTSVPSFHSHLESLSLLSESRIVQAISLSGINEPGREGNVVKIAAGEGRDPLRFRAIHSFLHS